MFSVNHLRLVSLSQIKSREIAPPAPNLHTTLFLLPRHPLTTMPRREEPHVVIAIPLCAAYCRMPPHVKAVADCHSHHCRALLPTSKPSPQPLTPLPPPLSPLLSLQLLGDCCLFHRCCCCRRHCRCCCRCCLCHHHHRHCCRHCHCCCCRYRRQNHCCCH